MKLFSLIFVLAASGLAQARAADPQWIWFTKEAGDGEVRYFRKEFTLPSVPAEARLYASGDDEAIAFVNGKQVGESGAWEQPLVAKGVEKLLHEGANVIAIRGKNHSGQAAAVARLDMKMRDGSKQQIVSDDTWKAGETEAPNWNSSPFDASAWRKPVVIAKLGEPPYGDVFASGGGGGGGAPAGSGTPVEEIATLPDFKVELVLNAEKARHGSWIAMAKDDKGRLILGSQGGNKITRLTVKDGKVVNDEDLNLQFSEPMGMLWAFNSLYINGNGKATDGKSGHGIYRLQDTRGDGHFDKIEQLFAWPGGAGGEHGSHGLVIGPGNKIYVVSGNFTDLPKSLLPTSPLRNFADDLVLPRAEDGNGFGAGRKPPGGSILRMDADGKNAELFAAGERNTYDIAFNADGELFGFDSDMEWDWGTPWYRPIRIFHATSGADQGFREGTGKWPEYYADSLPAVVNIGLGSPTGVIFGYGAKFPAKYQNALYVLDWTYGRLIAAHLAPDGASYSATWENFVAPKSLRSNGRKWPLNLTAAIIGDDGSMYFTVGGRDTQASLYRVTYSGSESTASAPSREDKPDRAIRRQLEAYHGKKDARVVAAVWPYLGNADRHIRYAARLAIESQPVEEWQARALAETKPAEALTGLLALARLGTKETQPAIFTALQKIPFASLTEQQQLDMLRVVEVSVARQGAPESAPSIVADFDTAYPSPSISVNRELCQTLLAFNVPDAVAKTIKLLTAAKTQEEQLTYILHLRTVKSGWTPELRATYFGWWNHRPPASHPDYVLKWFDDAGRPYGDGASFNNFVQNIHADAERTLTAQEIDQLQPVLAAYVPANARPPRKPSKQRGFVKVWEVADIEPLLGETSHGRNFENGRDAFAAGQCLLCHRFGDEGGAVGPDLTAISARYSMHDILESIVEPSKVISEQYANEEFKLKNGDLAVGRVIAETDDKVTLRPSLLAPQMQEIKKSDIVSKNVSKVSPMPPALISTLSKEDVLDLLAYLASGGRKDAPAFSK